MNKCLKSIQQLLYAKRCSICQSPDVEDISLCARCERLLPSRINYCRTCGAAIPQTSVDRCGRCLTSPLAFDSLLAPFWYEAPIDDWLVAYKFHAQWHYGALFTGLFLKQLDSDKCSSVECLLPVPMHAKRIRMRGFNQADDWARLLHRELGVEILSDAVKRIRYTAPQISLSGKARTKNVKKAFELNTKRLDYLSQFRSVAIVDDVVTTASTVHEIAKLLKKLGIPKVMVWSVARAK